jgi:hypothetical protein
MHRIWRTNLPLMIAFFTGTIMIAGHFIPRDPFGRLDNVLSDYFNIIAVFAFILGGGNLMRVHLTKVSARHREAPYSIVTLAGFLIMLIAGLFRIGVPAGQPYDDTGGLFAEIYRATFEPLSASMFALLAFFVASAAFRAFRARTLEATLLLLAAFVILIGRTPVGYYLTSWIPDQLALLRIPELSAFIMSAFNTAGQRAIQMGIALGIISTSLKLILGIERSYLGREE